MRQQKGLKLVYGPTKKWDIKICKEIDLFFEQEADEVIINDDYNNVKGPEMRPVTATIIKVKDEDDISKSDIIKKVFPDLGGKMEYSEDGFELFAKITSDINKHNREDASRLEKVFKDKGPYVTYFLIAVNVIFFLVPTIMGSYSDVIMNYCVHGPSVRAGQYYRLLTGIFLHGSLIHLLLNCYAIYAIGSQIENFLGRVKYAIIYLFAGIIGSLFSISFSAGAGSVGASGAIFGLMGAMLYFGYYYRVYLGNALKSSILPVIIMNLGMGFLLNGVDNFAHIGGLIGGTIMTMALGVKDKSSSFEKTNGWVIVLLFTAFLIYFAFVYSA